MNTTPNDPTAKALDALNARLTAAKQPPAPAKRRPWQLLRLATRPRVFK